MSHVHTAEVHIRWSDFDRFGHLNNLSYIELAQEARASYAQQTFEAENLPVPAAFVAHIEADYARPLFPDTQEARIDTVVTHIGSSSFTTKQTVYDREGNACAVVTAIQVTVDLKSGKPREITEAEREIFSRSFVEEEAK
ncbi:MAG: thioesterase family protein [Corynebacterium sp.]|nr:thioesterase family protein [Corynebacterium sp.]